VNVSVQGVVAAIEGVGILDDVTIHVPAGSFHGVVGPNGSGKSTLLRCVYRAIKPMTGAVTLGDHDLWTDLTARTAALRRAVVSQDNVLDLDFSVREVVAMGRTPHKGLFDRDTDADVAIVDEALRSVEMAWAAGRIVTTLSGGERQRVMLARAIAQQAPILVLDEPTNHLDIRAQLELLELVKSLRLTTMVALHDLDHAASMCDQLTLLERGRVVATGAPLDVLTREQTAKVFGVDAHIGTHPITGRPQISFATLSPKRATTTHVGDHTREP
jgi:iron complex transport system ATP-binding protein